MDLNLCADKLKVLADTTRLSVLDALFETPTCVNDLALKLNIEQSLLSHHLSTLRRAGLVTFIRRGKSIVYKLTPGICGTRKLLAIDLGCCTLSFSSVQAKAR